MAIMLPNSNEVQISRLVKGLYSAAAGNTYMTAFVAEVGRTSMNDFANWLAGTVSSSSATLAANVVANLELTGTAATDATSYLTSAMDADPSNHGKVILDALTLFSTLTSDSTYGSAASAFNDSVATAYSYSMNSNNTSVNLATLQAADGLPQLILTPDQDILVGTAADDLFIARGNSSLDNADMLDGGAGTDTLEVMLDNNETAESPMLTNIEILKVQGQQAIANSGDNDVDGLGDVEANIDAGDMTSVVQYWSEDSRADVTIEDVSHNSHTTTIGMRATDPGDVDYNVFFDPENITGPGMGDDGTTLIVKAVNVVELAAGGNILSNFKTLKFDVGPATGAKASIQVDMAASTTHAQLVTAINTALADPINVAAIQAIYPTYAVGDIVASITTTAQATNTLTGVVVGSYDVISITSPTKVLTANGISLDASANVNEMNNSIEPSTIDANPYLTQTDVILDRVGKGSEGGDLLIGSDSTGDSGSKGVQQFNVQVDRSSWLTSMSSTNNTLEVVNVENISTNNTAGDGNLTIVNRGAGFGLQDVRVFDADTMVGSATIEADLSSTVTAKYLNRVDSAASETADNSEISYAKVEDTEFSYDFGSANDSLTLTIASANLDGPGTTTREDFVLRIDGGAGDDKITTTIVDEATGLAAVTTATSPWYINSELNNNLAIDAGTGNDTVRTQGSGSWNVDLGTGNDVIYSDNTGAQAEAAVFDNGGRAVWVLNTNDQVTAGAAERNIDDLVSDSNENYGLLKADLTVSLCGVTSTVSIAENNTTDLGINNAIKEAIQTNVYLKNLIVAEDGPANTLVIRSLVDSDFTTADFGVSLASTTLTAADNISGFDAANGGAGIYTTLAAVQAKVDADVATFNAALDYNTAMANDGAGTDLTGANSTAITASNIVAGAGLDTIVLCTSNNGTETVDLGSDNEIDVVFNATNAVITGLDATDIIVFRDGTIRTTFTGAELTSFTVTSAGGGSTPPVTGGTSTVAVSAAGSSDASAADVTYTFAQANYAYTVAGFAAGDVLDVLDGAALTITNTDGADGIIGVSVADGTSGTTVEITLTGVDATSDAAIFSTSSFNTVFGTGSLA